MGKLITINDTSSLIYSYYKTHYLNYYWIPWGSQPLKQGVHMAISHWCLVWNPCRSSYREARYNCANRTAISVSIIITDIKNNLCVVLILSVKEPFFIFDLFYLWPCLIFSGIAREDKRQCSDWSSLCTNSRRERGDYSYQHSSQPVTTTTCTIDYLVQYLLDTCAIM